MPSLDSLFSIEYVVTKLSSLLPAHLETHLGHIRVDPGLCKVHVCQGYRGDILGGVDQKYGVKYNQQKYYIFYAARKNICKKMFSVVL